MVTEEKQTGVARSWRQVVMHSVSWLKWIKVKNLHGKEIKEDIYLETSNKFRCIVHFRYEGLC